MSDIQAGDLVVCVDVSTILGVTPKALAIGRHYRVARVGRGITPNDADETFLIFAPHPVPVTRFHGGYRIERFRKIRPAEDEFTQLIRKMKPAPAKERTDA